MNNYDSKEDTKKHIKRVSFFITKCIYELSARACNHDRDKIENPTEKKLFDEYTPKLKDCTYGSDEYKTFLEGLKEGLKIHYENNRHHPEHFENGIKGMNLIDLQERFGYSDDLKVVLENTVSFLLGEVKQ